MLEHFRVAGVGVVVCHFSADTSLLALALLLSLLLFLSIHVDIVSAVLLAERVQTRLIIVVLAFLGDIGVVLLTQLRATVAIDQLASLRTTLETQTAENLTPTVRCAYVARKRLDRVDSCINVYECI